MTDPVTPPPEPQQKLYKNPFIIAFALGVVALTALPFLQRGFLRAPPPGPSLGSWSTWTLDGGSYGSAELQGKVWLASFAPDAKRQAAFGALWRHLDDYPEKIVLVSLVVPGAEVPDVKPPHWVKVTGPAIDALAMEHFRPALESCAPSGACPNEFATADAGTTVMDFAQMPAVALVDQNGALRAFWKDDDMGRSNIINAARLLAKYGPQP